MPRIVLISDTHGFQGEMPFIPDGDILIHAGDLTRRGNCAELGDVNTFFAALPHEYKICIAGNHDFCLEQQKDKAKEILSNVVYLQDKMVRVMGLKIYGSPWQPRFCDWAFNLDRGEALRKVWAMIPDDTDVLVTHGPPYGIGDTTDGAHHHVGCRDLLARVSLIKPKLHVFGHIHNSYGVADVEGTKFVNASICDEAFRPSNAPVVVDL